MASVVAMASVLEDFDTQPCKKSSKDGGSTVVKTITSYFSPVAKAVEKPRSNNIRDYFSRGPLTSKVKTNTSEHPKGICHRSAEKHTNQEVAVKRPSLKQRRAVTNARRKPVNLETDISSDEASCFIAEKSHGNTNSATDSQSVSAVTGSDTAALLAQINADTLTSNQSIESNTSEPIKQAQKEKHHEGPSGCEKDGKPGMNMSTNNTLLPKPAHHTRKKKQIEGNRSESEQKCVENSCAVSMELNGTEGSELKSNTVMISFEDFVRSQSEVKGDDNQTGVQCEGNKLAQEADEIETRQLRPSQAKENIASTELCVQVSPRTISIQAQMHTISPTREGVNPKGRGELLISRRKNQGSIGNEALRSHTELATAKRKSNVVLDEDELDLAVLESESFPKSTTEVERRHFMAAFKQPSLDGSKQKTAKIQGKQKQHAEKDPEEINIQENAMVAKTKPQRKCRKAAEKVTTSSKPPEETLPTKSDDIQEESDVSLNHSMPVVRRSRREVFVRQAIKASEASSTTDRWNPNNLKDPPENSKLSSPKRRKSKHGVYEAEMICPPDGKKGPIRITFRRVQQTVSGSGKNALASIALNNSKKQKKAKKLVEKAKAIQQIKKGAVEKKNPLRRSSRTEASSSKSYFEDENSIICLEEDQIASPQMGPQKSKTKYLRCLNDVLGKATKAPTVSKGTLTAQEKNVCRASAVISIFDDSSQEGSENSQDDEQFRARREFLKSGLPESFKKQMAKAAATKETYTRSCASFQPVIHVTQIPNDCPLWNLSWPKSPQLHCLKENCIPVSKPLLPLNGSFGMKTQPERGVFRARGSGWSLEMSEKVRQLLMDEVSTSNPLFASKTLMARLLARRADYQQQSEAGSIQSAPELVRGKRKRNPDDLSKVAKKQRATHPEGNIRPLEPSKRAGRTRQAQRARADMAKDSPSPVKDDVIVLDNLCEGTEKKVEAKDEVLWTEKYQPQQSSDIIGNTASVRRLHCWLKEWKLRADREERIKQKEKEREEGCNDSDWDCGEEDPLLAEDSLYNTVLITGPTGIGKTAAVYACAQELGFKVFEVNASSQRSGRLILSQLKEATQSHQVDSQGVNANKPAYFNSYSKGSSTGKQSTSPRKTNSPRRVVSSPRKGPNSPRGAKRGGLTPTSLANFFKTGQPSNKESASTKRDDQKSSPKKMKAQEDTRKQKDTTIKSTEEIEESSKKTAISLILFEEVDVIFEEDSGFLAAIKMFMSTTKRPVIVTTSDPAFSTVFDGNFEEVHFKTPSLLDVSSYLRLLCLAEGKRTDQHDVNTLLELNGCDIRQSLLQLQCWTRSAGGRPMMSPTADTNPNGNQLKAATCGEAADMCPLSEASVRPPCETGCTESLLGLLNIEPGRDVWEPLRNQTREIACWDLLMESTRRGVNLLYSNMESLFPLPRTQLISTYKPDAPHVIASACTQSDLLPPHARLLDSPESDDGSPVKVSNRMRRHSIPDQDGLHSDCDSEESFLSLCKQHGGSQEKEVPTEKLVPQMDKRKPLTPAERLKSVPVSKCLESISDFFNNMCDIDSLLVHHGADARRGNPQLSTVVKDGMTDEPRVEVDTLSWVMGERVVEVRTSAEALSFHKCRLSVAEAWDRAQQLEGQLAEQAEAELTLPVASHRESCSFTQSSLSQPQVVQQRRDLMESLVFRGTFSTLGNRSAFAVDYLPALRAICRSEQIREQGKVKRRFLHYLDSIHLGLHKNTLQYLSSDFP
ncbi:ATPase family AAA domain-containing protein 5 [Syngnathoides biaculeatus]|uniref:ATPase family AAA domain-containing protein 5 n=1 Tax=Syngnathoides biaculeatus TaxID=300417 RepID=UPI002ADD7BDC|nr:ATPase family AAA domain-containing protein 5 [Syngnathoides biaculeatus]XP_061702275.1 ATPase family AAA domain-containing protein 5 [Syngnathoides biaculeatus]